MISTAQVSFSRFNPSMTARSSMRLFVVCGSEPNISRRYSPKRKIKAQPPRPGLPLQAPSVIN